ncbi:endo-1,4-beta-xylanase [Paenibacillus sp. LHD-117]|uniref:endo-1,4-beta-xylanase n=1 Tax=Paenibacillus sp. LHD-117 TaxID=3071412 RepID=UPI0027E149C1|nr:endo-1,4-beta-xylanase [Paenibacillus sp. LHD-117]MDQ6417873.1 endo-1,4-beta-xylanase [Paenibacillus sp. LHD-117]
MSRLAKIVSGIMAGAVLILIVAILIVNRSDPNEPAQSDIPSLAVEYADFFPIGAAIEPSQTNGLKAGLLKKHVNWLVAENVMKPDSIHPAEETFNWSNADKIVAFAKENGMEIRYHTLVWHSQVGAWFFKDSEGKPMVDETDPVRQKANKKLLLERLDTHVRTIVDRYKNDIKSWDVVNEVIEPADPDGMRASEWYKIAGIDYIATAFQAAREAGGPDIKLYINDYGTDDPRKRDLLYDLVKKLLDQGVPIDGVGHQTHIDVYGPTVESIIESMRKFAELGLDNIVTELDMSIYSWNDRSDYGTVIPEEILAQQAKRYGELFQAFRDHREILSGVVFWGIADDHTWLNGFPVKRTNAPLLFDKQYQAKPAFWSVVDPSVKTD